jgi:hypothetical protein
MAKLSIQYLIISFTLPHIIRVNIFISISPNFDILTYSTVQKEGKEEVGILFLQQRVLISRRGPCESGNGRLSIIVLFSIIEIRPNNLFILISRIVLWKRKLIVVVVLFLFAITIRRRRGCRRIFIRTSKPHKMSHSESSYLHLFFQNYYRRVDD